MKRAIIVLWMLIFTTCLTACSMGPCTHEWGYKTCTAARVCKRCGKSDGVKLGHAYKGMGCTEARTCELCGESEGVVFGHDFKEATCSEAKTCQRCGAAEGAALGHDLAEATCAEAAKCKRCNVVQGEALGHTSDAIACGRCGQNLTAWQLAYRLDAFKRPTEQKYIYVDSVSGEFNTAEITDGVLSAQLEVDADIIAIVLKENGDTPLKGAQESERFGISVLDAAQTKHSFEGTLSRAQTQILISADAREEFLSLLEKNNTLQILVESEQDAACTYLFKIQTKGFALVWDAAEIAP